MYPHLRWHFPCSEILSENIALFYLSEVGVYVCVRERGHFILNLILEVFYLFIFFSGGPGV
jgi:hypothetical protein